MPSGGPTVIAVQPTRAESAPQDEAVVLVVDDDSQVRNALGSLFRSVGIEVVLLGSAAELFAFGFPDAPCCLVLDVRLKGQSGLDVQARMAELGIHVPIIFMTGHGDIPMTVAAMKAGAEHFLSKPLREQELLDAVTTAIQKESLRLERVRRLAAVRDRYCSLTPRECEVMAHAASGLTNKEIAVAMCISVVTVKVHRCQAMRKMRARSFADLVLLAQTLGLVFLPSETDGQPAVRLRSQDLRSATMA
ncbi:response regulator transcription factor [Cupriavidus sp. a3]|uniref:response regulator transcription factor n=1 Tax=Cupriavidus sp. a3 TaxID=3242158 RepID=UPI003D9C60E1